MKSRKIEHNRTLAKAKPRKIEHFRTLAKVKSRKPQSWGLYAQYDSSNVTVFFIKK